MIVDHLREELARLNTEGLDRRHRIVGTPTQPLTVVDGHQVVAFCSNDYLGLANHPELVKTTAAALKKWGVGAGASHLISGHQAPHEAAEQALARFVGRDRALLFSTGYMANLGVVQSLVGRGDVIFADRLNHASLIDAAQLSRADHLRYTHNDVGTLRAQLAASTARRKMILTDGVFSMDGDLAHLAELLELAEKHDAWLVVDDAHGFGVLGERGEGSLAHCGLAASPRVVQIGTLGKAAGVAGAFVAGDPTVIDYLLQTARPHIFTTAQPAALAAAITRSVELIADPATGGVRRAHLLALIARLRDGLAALPWELLPSPTAIQPIVVGGNEEALRLSAGLLAAGYFVPAIRPPTVPAGKARLRITLSAAHTATQVDGLLATLRSLA